MSKIVFLTLLCLPVIGLAQPYQLMVQAGHKGVVRTVTLSKDGRLLLTGSRDGTIKIWEARTRKLLRTYNIQQGGIKKVDFSVDGKYILIGTDRLLQLLDTNTGKTIHSFEVNVFLEAARI